MVSIVNFCKKGSYMSQECRNARKRKRGLRRYVDCVTWIALLIYWKERRIVNWGSLSHARNCFPVFCGS